MKEKEDILKTKSFKFAVGMVRFTNNSLKKEGVCNFKTLFEKLNCHRSLD